MSNKRRRTDSPMQLGEMPSDGFSSETLVRLIEEIRRIPGSKKQRMDIVGERYPQFVVNHPRLYHMVCDDTFDMERFQHMLRLRDSIRNREETVEDVSKRVGQELFDIYVKDKVAHLQKN